MDFRLHFGTTADLFIAQLVSWLRLVSSALQFEMDINMSPCICMKWGGRWGVGGYSIAKLYGRQLHAENVVIRGFFNIK